MTVEEGRRMDTVPMPPALAEARAALASEWDQRQPETPEEILAFYAASPHMAADLDAWHATDARQSWTRMLVHVAASSGARCIVDIGCGRGHDLAALREALPEAILCGVEPNHAMRAHAEEAAHLDIAYEDAQSAPVEGADLLVCCDVLEHVPDPEAFLGAVARRAKLGSLLFETVGTEDCTTPLHLAQNRGWHPGRVLEQHGWQIVDAAEAVRVWRRDAETGRQAASLLLCAYRGVTSESLKAIMGVTGSSGHQWRLRTKTGDSWIGRSRSIIVTKWWAETNDDAFLMVDDDVAFQPGDADRAVELVRNGYDIVCGAYPVHNGAHLSLKCWPGTEEIQFGPGQPPVEVQYAATGFMAVHRRVIDALIGTMELVHPRQPWAYYPLFPTPIVTDANGEPEHLSEDYGFCEIARRAGFTVWLDPQTRLSHGSNVPVTVSNMGAIYSAIQRA